MTIPNYITLLRLLLVPFVVWSLLTGQHMAAFVAFVVAGVSDGVDGFIARRFDMRSELGSYIDPIADKLLLVSVFIVLGYQGVLPIWLVAIVVFRDALIVSGVMLASVMGRPVEMRPLFVSKANTVAQIMLAGVALMVVAFELDWTWSRPVLFIAVAALTAASAAAYLMQWLRHMTDNDNQD
ncbi:MAG: CDP-alcohol phosphatidyltransferase family protein [Rhizobiaceae bacterium]